MMAFLLDTNVLSELRKADRANPAVLRWRSGAGGRLYLSVITLGEVRQGIMPLRERDPEQAAAIEQWLFRVEREFSQCILNVTRQVADRWGSLPWRQPLPAADGLIAATALVHGLTVVTRNVSDFERAGVPVVDPFE